MQLPQTKLTTKLQQDTIFIFKSLVSLGNSKLLTHNLPTTDKQIQIYCQQYFQPTAARFELIDWLITVIQPQQEYGIQEQHASRSNNQGNIGLCERLWAIGAMSYSKHTRNLDYERYVQGLLGEQNSIGLIHTLCELAITSKNIKKAKTDHRFGTFLNDLFDNYNILVNENYNPYDITFPAMYDTLSDNELDQLYSQIQRKLKKECQQKQDQPQLNNSKTDAQTMFKTYEQYRQTFMQRYQHLASEMQRIITQKSSLIKNWQSNPELSLKIVNIPVELTQVYQKYKSLVQLQEFQADDLLQRYNTINKMIVKLNEGICDNLY